MENNEIFEDLVVQDAEDLSVDIIQNDAGDYQISEKDVKGVVLFQSISVN